MTKDEWRQLCAHMVALWPGRKLPAATEEAWYQEWAWRCDAEVVGKVLSRLVSQTDRAPTLSALRAEYVALGGTRGQSRAEEQEALYTDQDMPRLLAIGRKWTVIIKAKQAIPELNALYHALASTCQPEEVREEMLKEIRRRAPETLAEPPVEDENRKGDLEPVSAALGEAL